MTRAGPWPGTTHPTTKVAARVQVHEQGQGYPPATLTGVDDEYDDDRPVRNRAPRVDPPRAPWDPAPLEPPEHHAWFESWLASGLTVSAWAQAGGRNVSTVHAVSGRHQWIPRRAAYRAHLRAIALSAAEHEARDRGVDLARMIDLAEAVVIRSLESALANPKDTLRPKDAVSFVKALHDIRALAAGRATSRVDLGAVPPAVLAAIRADIRGESEGGEPEPEGA